MVIREYGRQGKGAPRWDLYLFVGRNIFRCILTDTGFHVADNDNDATSLTKEPCLAFVAVEQPSIFKPCQKFTASPHSLAT